MKNGTRGVAVIIPSHSTRGLSLDLVEDHIHPEHHYALDAEVRDLALLLGHPKLLAEFSHHLFLQKRIATIAEPVLDNLARSYRLVSIT